MSTPRLSPEQMLQKILLTTELLGGDMTSRVLDDAQADGKALGDEVAIRIVAGTASPHLLLVAFGIVAKEGAGHLAGLCAALDEALRAHGHAGRTLQ